ncbi:MULTISPECIES: DegT/DnrJ/EryC1/StrS aminotransferase family protein [unclassified Crossiella]|uniref:DegT/DnrJ/EryC1/StrS family aminotransferase n=1 Tax=unclassified Crossiella TaxID=2620835 RepID=UPI001FFE4D1A|nr:MULTISPECIES: DegT/DnrJ/EryC1/StrS family aminotransferase [unclassified Crossiella]MCK2245426.1 DegT/DnrJ/EryC1/StrS family aminotransferase [Crossiella sp. S99.2]MCK2259078.1 DegT/DnrJ/EryC1/StrS family aminotransferase [Crossiella sp. S99.1]
MTDQLAHAIGAIDLTDDKSTARELEKFEQALAVYCGVDSAVAVASGTDALTIALKALKAPAGSEVITCDFGFYATASSILAAGLTPVFVDSSPGQMTIDIDAITRAISARTGAVVPVHLFGEAVDMAAIQQVATKSSVAVVEDAAQALGSRSGGRLVGSFGSAAGVSFNWSKHLSSTSNGGAVLTDSPDMAAQLRHLRNYGDEGGFSHTHLGMNSKLNPFEAAVLRVKLPYLDGWIERRRDIAAHYDKNFSDSPAILTPGSREPAAHVYHKYTIRVPRRDELRCHLKARGVGSLAFYPRLLHDQPALVGQKFRAEDVENATQLVDQVLSLPIYPELTDSEVDFISEAVIEYFGEHR